MKYDHLFFDLDGTLWDFGANSKQTLSEIFINEDLQEKGIPGFDDFFEVYSYINQKLWALFRESQIEKEELSWKRFNDSLLQFKIDDVEMAKRMSVAYITESPRKTILMEGAIELLNYLYEKYQLHILTNGFTEVQYPKIENSGLKRYFTHVITSAEAGFLKPSPSIFEYAMKKTGAIPEKSLMIGDDAEVDCAGARSAGWDAIFLNPNSTSTENTENYQIRRLSELKKLL
ncbi:MAG: YjjG family noncanonical pyrimidine nucleotidase [Bacteroidales bacterium]|jgi:putative hydrolase of the HAD superfamily|nr:YjjG family noncanonical pyrimidine nucleotidase [Bacteroidales bacterium]